MFRTFSAAVSCCDFSSLKLGSVFPIHSETARLWKGQNCQNIYSLSADSAFCKQTKVWVFFRISNTFQGRIMFVGDDSGNTIITTTITIIKIIIMIIIIQVTQYFLNCTPFNYVTFQFSIKGGLLQWQKTWKSNEWGLNKILFLVFGSKWEKTTGGSSENVVNGSPSGNVLCTSSYLNVDTLYVESNVISLKEKTLIQSPKYRPQMFTVF